MNSPRWTYYKPLHVQFIYVLGHFHFLTIAGQLILYCGSAGLLIVIQSRTYDYEMTKFATHDHQGKSANLQSAKNKKFWTKVETPVVVGRGEEFDSFLAMSS